MTIDATGLDHRALNTRIKEAIAQGETDLEVTGLCGHRYLGCGVEGEVDLHLHGIPGNDLAAFMSGPRLLCSGNVQDGVANTMDAGLVEVPGHAGDVLGYSMRGGQVLVRGNAGYRIGIHMKSYEDKSPTIVIGGRVKDFAGEYMAGGTLIILGLDLSNGEPLVGRYCGTGMHGGEMFVRGEVPEWSVGKGVAIQELTEADLDHLRQSLGFFCDSFGGEVDELMRSPFCKLSAVSTRPHGQLYAY